MRARIGNEGIGKLDCGLTKSGCVLRRGRSSRGTMAREFGAQAYQGHAGNRCGNAKNSPVLLTSSGAAPLPLSHLRHTVPSPTGSLRSCGRFKCFLTFLGEVVEVCARSGERSGHGRAHAQGERHVAGSRRSMLILNVNRWRYVPQIGRDSRAGFR